LAGEFDRVEDGEVVFYVQGGVHVFQRMRGEEDRTQIGLRASEVSVVVVV
jgi:hypothetical protein